MLRWILSLFSFFDWYTPVWALIQENRNWPVTGFYVPYDAGLSTHGVQRLLAGKGVKVIGTDLYGQQIRFSVPATQAEYAEYLLSHAKVPYSRSRNRGESREERSHGLTKPFEPRKDLPASVRADATSQGRNEAKGLPGVQSLSSEVRSVLSDALHLR